MQRGTISIHLVEEALVEARARDVRVEALLAAAGIDPALLREAEARVPATQYAALWLGLAQALDCEFFAMDSHPMRPGSFTLMCRSAHGAPTVGQGLRRALRFIGLILDDFEARLSLEGERAAITLDEHGPPRRAFTYCTFWLIVYGLTCWLAGRRIPLRAASFRCPEPAYTDDYRTLFTHDLHFGRSRTRLEFDAAVLDLPVKRSEAELKSFLRKAPANILVKYRSNDSLTVRVRQSLRRQPPTEWPDFDTLAAGLHMSASTLRRRLDGEGESYQSIKDSLRRDLAVQCLARGDASVAEIAARLGFSEPSSFHRAFKKWTGLQPREYRRRHNLRAPLSVSA
ncbi:AraC family transcriptional regulator [Zavarzinia compransoris]|uniref:AraC family transcriptional regulator n=1 Tax=Zavarzinia marina TaxID=2911065 RepID=UPI001F15CD57|nr:AraC family transcriptional regulator [Zavarzinia marina]MCF4164063.1 AraC family transcriptional regulator [Zavarzinia marina]